MNLNQVTVGVSVVPKSIIFYQKLGLKRIVHAHDDYARFECPSGDSTFSVHRVDELPNGTGVSIYFECEDLDAHVDKLMANGLTFSEKPNDKSWLWREAHLNDPDGNHLILFQAGENRKNPPWRL